MVFEPNFSKIVSSVRKNIGNTQTLVEIKLPTNEDSVNKIYSVQAKVVVFNVEPVGSDINYNGVVKFNILGGNDEVVSLDYSAEFKDKFSTNAEISGEIIVRSHIVDSNATISSDGIKVSAVVELVFDEINTFENSALTTVNANDVYVSTKQITYNTYLGKASEKIDTEVDVELKDATKVLSVNPCINLCKVIAKDNFMVVEGVINYQISYMDGLERNSIRMQEHSENFSWEVAFSGLSQENTIESMANLLINEMQVMTTDIENGINLSITLPITYNGYVFESSEMEVVDDIYLESNYLSITTENFDTTIGNESISFKDNISGTASISDAAPFIDEVLGVSSSNLVVASVGIDENKLSLEGVASATIMYYTKETNDISSVQVEMPFIIEEKIEGEYPAIVSVCIANISARSKRGKEIEVSAEINAYVDAYSTMSDSIISDIVLGDEKPEEDCSLFIYIVRPGQTLWDVAKENNVSQELILEQNPELELPVRSGDKIIIYKPKVMEF